jgi:hypothetical protein
MRRTVITSIAVLAGSTVDVRLDADLHKVAIDRDSEAEDR